MSDKFQNWIDDGQEFSDFCVLFCKTYIEKQGHPMDEGEFERIVMWLRDAEITSTILNLIKKGLFAISFPEDKDDAMLSLTKAGMHIAENL